MKKKDNIVRIFEATMGPPLPLPEAGNRVKAGFASPAEDYVDRKLDLNEHLIQHPAATFFVEVTGDSMEGAGIFDGDMLIVDRALDARSGSIVIAVVDNEFTVKTLGIDNGCYTLFPANDRYQPIIIKEGMQFEVWGVVTSVIHRV